MNLSEAYEHLSRVVKGEILLPGEPEYELRRKIWNTRLSCLPALIVSCRDSADVSASVEYFGREGIAFSVKGGGHSFAGNGLSQGNPMIDLSGMKRIEMDPAGGRVLVQPGVKWGELYERTMQHELAVTGGTVSGVGVSGYTLGGGTGYLARPFGLAIDNVLSMEVVTSTGKILSASAEENVDLFWALRGGSGNFGVVTNFEFKLHKVSKYIYAGQVMYPYSVAEKALLEYREVMQQAPHGFTCYACAMKAPPIDIFPPAQHGKTIICFVFAQIGSQRLGEKAAKGLRTIAPPILDTSGPHSFLDVQQAFDEGCPQGQRWYSKSNHMSELSDEAINTFVQNIQTIPGEFSLAYLEPLGGAIRNCQSDQTAFPHRDALFSFNILAGWALSSEDKNIINWANSTQEEMASHSSCGVYVNMLSENESSRIATAYGSNFERLKELKKKWDPNNVFRKTYNIVPD